MKVLKHPYEEEILGNYLTPLNSNKKKNNFTKKAHTSNSSTRKTHKNTEKFQIFRQTCCRNKAAFKSHKCENPNKLSFNKTVKEKLSCEMEFLIILKEFISLDKEIEIAKQDLALRPDFNLIDSFSLFDFNKKGMITAAFIEKALNLIGLH